MTPVDHRPDAMRFVLVAKLRSYLGLHDEAITVLDEGLATHPGEPLLLRHRGEFLLTVRRYDEAMADLAAAAEALAGRPDVIDPYRAQLLPLIDGLLLGRIATIPAPERVDDATAAAYAGSYVGTLASSTWYHLALAQYLGGDHAAAAATFRTTLDHAVLDDMRAAVTNWLYLALRRAGEETAARSVLEATPSDLGTAEPSYARNLEVYRGHAPPKLPAEGPLRSRVTQGYGAAAWLLAEGRRAEGLELLRQVVDAGDATAFGHLAALEDLARLEPA